MFHIFLGSAGAPTGVFCKVLLGQVRRSTVHCARNGSPLWRRPPNPHASLFSFSKPDPLFPANRMDADTAAIASVIPCRGSDFVEMFVGHACAIVFDEEGTPFFRDPLIQQKNEPFAKYRPTKLLHIWRKTLIDSFIRLQGNLAGLCAMDLEVPNMNGGEEIPHIR